MELAQRIGQRLGRKLGCALDTAACTPIAKSIGEGAFALQARRGSTRIKEGRYHDNGIKKGLAVGAAGGFNAQNPAQAHFVAAHFAFGIGGGAQFGQHLAHHLLQCCIFALGARICCLAIRSRCHILVSLAIKKRIVLYLARVALSS